MIECEQTESDDKTTLLSDEEISDELPPTRDINSEVSITTDKQTAFDLPSPLWIVIAELDERVMSLNTVSFTTQLVANDEITTRLFKQANEAMKHFSIITCPDSTEINE